MDDNLYPNDGQYFLPTEPLEQSVERKKEKAHTLEALPVIKQLITNLEERIANTDSIQNAFKLAESHEISREEALVCLDVIRQQLEVELGSLKALLEEYAPNL